MDSLVKIDNSLVWDGIKHPFFESYYLSIHGPKAEWAFWLQYSLCAREKSKGSGFLNGAFLNADGETTVISNEFDLAKYEVIHADRFMTLSHSHIALAESIGSIQDQNKCLKWELAFEDPSLSFSLFPHTSLYQLFGTKTKLLSPRMVSFITGNVYADGFKKEISRARVHQGHFHTKKLPKKSLWASCVHFKEDSSAYFELYATQVSKKLSLSKVSIHLGSEGDHLKNSLMNHVATNRLKETNGTWHFSFKRALRKYDCVIETEEKNKASFAYQDHSKRNITESVYPLAKITIKVYERRGAAWQFIKTLSSEKCVLKSCQV